MKIIIIPPIILIYSNYCIHFSIVTFSFFSFLFSNYFLFLHFDFLLFPFFIPLFFLYFSLFLLYLVCRLIIRLALNQVKKRKKYIVCLLFCLVIKFKKCNINCLNNCSNIMNWIDRLML